MAAVTRTRFETPRGLQSQIDWEQARIWFGTQREVRHIFVLTLDFSRRSALSERDARPVALDAHEQAFAYFGGHTQEHLYDRPRTVCEPRGAGGVRWNTTFKAFADFWGFEPRLWQLEEWTATVADVRVHGTTHERPLDRFARERDALVPAPAGRAFRLDAPLTRVVATDYLVSVDTNRYSVPFTLIGQAGGGTPAQCGFWRCVTEATWSATHPVLGGRHQLRILPEHGPGPTARNARMRFSTGGYSTAAVPLAIEVRDLACYEAA